MDCRVVLEAAVPVYDVDNTDEAVRIAISKTGEMLNPDLNYVEIEMGSRACPSCDEDLEPAFVAADEALVALELEMTVFNVEGEQHASRITRKEIGQRLEDIPLKLLSVTTVDDGDDETDSGLGRAGTDVPDDGRDVTDANPASDADEEVLPEFEELLEDQ